MKWNVSFYNIRRRNNVPDLCWGLGQSVTRAVFGLYLGALAICWEKLFSCLKIVEIFDFQSVSSLLSFLQSCLYWFLLPRRPYFGSTLVRCGWHGGSSNLWHGNLYCLLQRIALNWNNKFKSTPKSKWNVCILHFDLFFTGYWTHAHVPM